MFAEVPLMVSLANFLKKKKVFFRGFRIAVFAGFFRVFLRLLNRKFPCLPLTHGNRPAESIDFTPIIRFNTASDVYVATPTPFLFARSEGMYARCSSFLFLS